MCIERRKDSTIHGSCPFCGGAHLQGERPTTADGTTDATDTVEGFLLHTHIHMLSHDSFEAHMHTSTWRSFLLYQNLIISKFVSFSELFIEQQSIFKIK